MREVLGRGTEEVPEPERTSALDPHLERVRQEVVACRGNLRRVHEELASAGLSVSYSALTRFAKRHGLGRPPKLPAGRYTFAPGEETQFDTSPHRVQFRDARRLCQCASQVLAYSRVLFFQYYPRFTRFEAKVFLTEGLGYVEGATARYMVDNTNLVILHGTGPDAVVTPEMAAFSKHFGFRFIAHRIGDANRSAGVERQFHFIENNFLSGRAFEDFDDLNRQARDFCDRANQSVKRHLRARPADLLEAERPHLKPLPAFIPEVYRTHYRIVDTSGYVNLDRNCYSAPWRLLGERVEVRESPGRVRIFHGPREVAAHDRAQPGRGVRVTDPAHRPPRGEGERLTARAPLPQETKLRSLSPTMDAYVSAIRVRSPGRAAAPLRRLHGMSREYPAEPFERAVSEALRYGLFDMERLERMVLRNIAGEYFPLPDASRNTPEDDHE